MPHISVVIPVYKAEKCLNELYCRLKNSIEKITKDFEIVLVDDCSPDKSWEIINDLSLKDKRIKGIQFSRNFGQHYGITAGLDYCNGDWVVIMDCDLQDSPEEILNIYKKANEGFDMVVVKRTNRKDFWLKKINSYIFYKVFSFFTDSNHDWEIGNFRIISRKVVENFRQMREQLRFFGTLTSWLGFPTAVIEAEHTKRFSGKSTYTLNKLFKLAIETIIAYSDKPLRLSIAFGFILSFLAFIYGGYIFIYSLLHGSTITGWGSTIVSIYFLGGVIIANLGIIGIYLGKTFDETKKRPLYIVRRYTQNAKF